VFQNKAVVIRSSATCEDSPFLSFAGQYSTFLNIKIKKQIKTAIKLCLLSLHSNNSKIYGSHHGVNLDNELIAVMIQEFKPVDIAGVSFTANPVTSDKNQIIIEYLEGLGDKIVSGEKKPKSITTSKKSTAKRQNRKTSVLCFT